MRYHFRLWLCAVLAQALVLALTVSMCIAVSVSLLIDEVAGNQRAYLETLDAYVQKVLYAAQRELIVMGEQTDWVGLAQRTLQTESGPDSLSAREEIDTQLIEAIASGGYFDTIYFVTPQRLFTSRFSNVLMQRSPDNPAQWLRDGAQMRNTLTLELGSGSYLVAQLNMERAFFGDVENLYAFNQGDGCIYAAAQSDALLSWLEENGRTVLQNSAPRNLYRIDGRLYRLVTYESVPFDRVYLSLLPVEDTISASLDSLKKVLLICAAEAFLMAAALYFASKLALRPMKRIAKQVRRETSIEALSGERVNSRRRVGGHLRWRVMCVFLLTLIPVVVTPLSTFAIFSRSNVQYMHLFYRKAMTQTAKNVGFSYSQLLRHATKLRASTELMRWYQQSSKDHSNKDTLLEIILELMPVMDGVTGMRLYDSDGEVLLSTTSFGEVLTDSLLREYQNSYRYITVSTDNLKDNDFAILFPLRATQFSEQYRLFACVGYVELHAEAPAVGNLDNAVTSGQELWYLYDRAAWRLLDTPMTSAYRQLIEGMAQGGMIGGGASDMQILDTKFIEGADEGAPEAYLLLSEPVSNTDWSLIALLSSDFLSSAETLLGGSMIVLAAALIVLFVGMSGLFTRQFMCSVWRLVQFFTAATPQDFEMPPWLASEGEVTLIAREFERAMMRISQLEEMERKQQEENLYLEKRKRDAEIVALQSQLDSHLICNLFASMQLLLRLEDTKALDNTLQVVSRFFRNEMAMDSMDVPLSREIALTKSYVEVQKTRFHDNLDVVWTEYDPALENLIVPKFIMQPVLENAIKHGMYADRTLQIRITLERRDDTLVICMDNNGCPVEENSIEPINQRIDDTAPTTHIGLRNIMERLRLRHGGESGVRLSTDENGWIRVTIWLPCQEENNAV